MTTRPDLLGRVAGHRQDPDQGGVEALDVGLVQALGAGKGNRARWSTSSDSIADPGHGRGR